MKEEIKNCEIKFINMVCIRWETYEKDGIDLMLIIAFFFLNKKQIEEGLDH